MSVELDVVEEAARARVLLDEGRLRLLEHLGEPDSAAGLARRLGLPRQRVNYHLRELEAAGLIELVEQRRRGNATERRYRRSGEHYAISNAVLGPLGPDPEAIADRFSSAYQVALAARTVRELGRLRAGAAAAGQALPTFALDAEIRFATPAARASFAEALAAAVADLVRRFHDEQAPAGRSYRLHLGAHPKPRDTAT